MRTSTVIDWICEVILLALFCGTVTLIDYRLSDKQTILTMWIVAGVWAAIGLVRLVYRHVNKPTS